MLTQHHTWGEQACEHTDISDIHQERSELFFPTQDPYASPRGLFAQELRRHRDTARLSQRALASRMGFSDSMIAMVETLRRAPTDDFARACDKALGLDGTMFALYRATNWSQAPEHLRPWLEEEEVAETLRSWEPMIVPGLLQTEKYARALISVAPGITSEEVDERLANRMRRQSIMQRPKPPATTFVLDEAVIRRRVGGTEVMREQLRFLMEAARRPSVTVQIVPYEAGEHCGLSGGFIVAERNGITYGAYTDAQPSGRTIEDRQIITQLTTRYDAVRAEALPFKQSLQLIEEAVNQSG
ncbi:helix-turn-helix transcriptional regulator [Sphaerisporangium sp. B11E5]|uniref:helix-turn-helix domain-containing protein n=1 Tax=Sphaerisporangium sp. B11E5 TaxID=3153563 RepID=UPI00325DFCBE